MSAGSVIQSRMIRLPSLVIQRMGPNGHLADQRPAGRAAASSRCDAGAWPARGAGKHSPPVRCCGLACGGGPQSTGPEFVVRPNQRRQTNVTLPTVPLATAIRPIRSRNFAAKPLDCREDRLAASPPSFLCPAPLATAACPLLIASQEKPASQGLAFVIQTHRLEWTRQAPPSRPIARLGEESNPSRQPLWRSQEEVVKRFQPVLGGRRFCGGAACVSAQCTGNTPPANSWKLGKNYSRS